MGITKEEISQHLNLEQFSACVNPNSIIVSACPGSGKTRTLTYRIAYLQSVFADSERLHVAITYTNRAANEIYDRLDEMDLDKDKIWVGTIHKFCLNFILKPYCLFSEAISNGMTIANGYRERELRELAKIKNTSLENICIEKREITFDGILKLANSMLDKYPFIAQNISMLIGSISIDEYQDTKTEQYEIISKIVRQEKNIKVSFFGDENQSIYGFCGGCAKSHSEIESLFDMGFKSVKLNGCYRSSQKIIDYYSNFSVNETNIESRANFETKDSKIYYVDNIGKSNLGTMIAEIIQEEINSGVQPNDICVVTPTNFLLNDVVLYFIHNCPNVEIDAQEIAPFIYEPSNPYYLIAKLVFTVPGKNTNGRKRCAREIIEIVKSEYSLNLPLEYDEFDLLNTVNLVEKRQDKEGIEIFKNAVKKIFDSMGIDLEMNEKLKAEYTDYLNNTIKRMTKIPNCQVYSDVSRYFNEKSGVVFTSIHKVKGEEYHTVIAYGILNGLIPYQRNVYAPVQQEQIEEARKLMYVLCSRAKKNLVLISQNGEEKYNKVLTPSILLTELKWEYDNK